MSISIGRLLRDKSIDRVAFSNEHRARWLSMARDVAVLIAKKNGRVTSDDVRKALPVPEGVDPRILGAVFRFGKWEKIGYTATSMRQAHARPISVWKLREEGWR